MNNLQLVIFHVPAVLAIGAVGYFVGYRVAWRQVTRIVQRELPLK